MSTARIAKTLLIILSVAVIAVGLLAGCRSETATNQQADGTRPATPPPSLYDGTVESADSRFAVDVRAAELAQREADLARREAEIARRESLAPAPRVAQAPRPAPRVTRPAPRPAVYQEPEPEYREPVRASRQTVTVPSGTAIAAEISTHLSSATSAPGDSVTARVAENVYAGGSLAIPAGSRLYGTVSDAHGLRKVGGRARLAVDFTSLELPSGQSVPFSADYTVLGRSETPKDAATIGGSAAAGAVLGHNVYKKDRDKGKILGAILGGAIGTAVASRTRGGEVEIPAGTVLDLTLDNSVSVRSSA